MKVNNKQVFDLSIIYWDWFSPEYDFYAAKETAKHVICFGIEELRSAVCASLKYCKASPKSTACWYGSNVDLHEFYIAEAV